MKKSFDILFLFSLIFLFFACANAGDTKLSYTDVDTLKETVQNKEANISWTRELEGGLLSENLTADPEKYKKGVQVTPLVAKLNKENQGRVYPEYTDFGSLDTSKLSFSVKDVVANFCSSLSDDFYTKPQNYFDSSYIFNLVFFRNELIGQWENHFKEKFPVEKEIPAQADGKQDSSSSDTVKPSLFTSWLFGEPFMGSEITQVPVRFYCQSGIIDVTLYVNKRNLINQVTINRWE